MASYDINPQADTLRLWTLAGLLIACFLFGGASRNDVMSLAVLQPLAVICATIFLLSHGPIRWASVRIPLLLLGALAAVMAVQLVPLPPDVWSKLPGHGRFTEPAQVAGIAQPWRGISLTPDLTLASLVGLVTPFAVLIGFASLPPERNRVLLPLMIGGIGLSALIGLGQVAGGAGSPFYFYDITNSDSPVGFFSNRNHQALALAMVWPMLAVWATSPAEPRFFAAKRWVAVSLSVFLLPMLLATGSRAGLALGALGLVVAWLLWRRQDAAAQPDRWSALLVPLGLGAAICVVAASIVLSRDVAFERITGVSFGEESRLQYLPTLIEISRDFFPVGAGFGGFDPLFRAYEPFALLQPTYLNHAHNDLVELIISGGLPAGAILAAFLAWLGLRARAVLGSAPPGRSIAFARLGLLIIVSVLLSSLVDYPLRTPLMAALFAVACGWLSVYDRRRERGTG